MMRSLSNDLARRARTLLEHDGRDSVVSNIHLGRDLTLKELYLCVDEKGTLVIETNTLNPVTVYTESPTGVIITTSPDNVLEDTIEMLTRHMVLDDLAGA